MPTRFRGITVREGVLIEGPAGWGEFGPVRRVRPRECAPLAGGALEAATSGWPAPVRDRSRQRDRPRGRTREAHAIVPASGCRTAKVKVADRGHPWPTTRPGWRRCGTRWAPAARSGSTRTAPGRSTRRGGAARAAAGAAWSTPSSRAPRSSSPAAARVDVPVAADESIRRAEDPSRAGLGRRRHRRPQGAAARRGAGGLARRRGHRAAGGGLRAVETSVGLAAGLALAAALPELRYACGLATLGLLTGDVTAAPLAGAAGCCRWRGPRSTRAAGGVQPIPRRGGRELLAAARYRDHAPYGRIGGRGPRCEPATALAAVLVAELAGCGVRKPCWPPARAARRWPSRSRKPRRCGGGLRLHTRIDERSAGFLALGLAKGAGARPRWCARRVPRRPISTPP